jgi:hypothetical protein
MNDKRDMAPMVWGYVKSRETARRMDAYAGEVQAMHPFYSYDSPARAKDMDLATTNAYALPGNITAGIQHGSWTMPVEKGRAPEPNFLNSNSQEVLPDLEYSTKDIEHVIDWTKRTLPPPLPLPSRYTNTPQATSKPHGTPSARAAWPRAKATRLSSTACSTSA